MKRFVDAIAGTPEKRIGLALMCLCAIIYVPLAGNYGLWDPWETHYGEVARQMAHRNDWISLWWPGSPQDRTEFWSKPVLTSWITALSFKLFGLEWAHAGANQMVADWRAEWAARMPHVLLSLAALWSIWALVSRLAGRRAGTLATIVLATSSQWAFISRQAMTDMPFVSPMTIALALAGLALLLPEEEGERILPRGELRLGRWRWSYPRAAAWWGFVALFVIVTLPQLIVISVQLEMVLTVGRGHQLRTIGLVPMFPYFVAFFVGLWWCARATNLRQLYLFSAYVLGAVASLAKGPAGIALPGIVLVLYLLFSGRWRDILFKLEIPRGVVLFVAAACPWYHAMLIRHGWPFWNEFIGDNYVHRAQGRHGDRGTFEYYIQYIGYGMFPWSGIATLAAALGFTRQRDRESPRAKLVGYALVWFLVEFSTVSIVNTKFHHYILPALPALAVLAGLFLDDLLRAPTRSHLWGLALVAVPLTFLSGRDLSSFPPRLLWEFNYDYVNAPGTGRPWPTISQYGTRYEYGAQILVFAIAATLAVAGLTLVSWLSRKETEQTPPPTAADDAQPSRYAAMMLGLAAVALVVGIWLGPSAPNGLAPTIARWAWTLPTLVMLLWLVRVATLFLRGTPSARSVLVWLCGAVAVAWTGFILDKILIELSPHWAQKHVVAAYYANRKGPEEPLIAWQLYWRGENFYTRNEIYDHTKPATEKTVFLGDRNTEKLQQYLTAHKGRRVFFIVERVRLEALRGLLPAEARQSLTVVDNSNNKLFLASAQLGQSAPLGTRSERLDDNIR
ncbi:MAG: Polymyxin resistance protein ArnT, undecaprenyl phosphate-alpha-L-Ara4N transferase [Myxococcales bacterium]|nr:Polymyxin resistance protein ArnT, undecaprenyl phosphate-alpha-L-Ara4N transferase [Myxococcales bacterium]